MWQGGFGAWGQQTRYRGAVRAFGNPLALRATPLFKGGFKGRTQGK